MRRVQFILTFILFSTFVFGQKIIHEETIQITKTEFKRKIIFNYKGLYNFSGKLDNRVLSIIDADEFFKYVTTNARTLLYKSVTDEQIEKFKTDFTNYYNTIFAKEDSYVLQRPTYQTAMEWRNALIDMNYAIFFILREKYYFDAMKQGQIKYQFSENDDFADFINVTVTQNNNTETGNLETRTKYKLNKQEYEVFSNLKTDRVDKSKTSLSNPNPIEWKVTYQSNSDGIFDIFLSAQIAELWNIMSIKQPEGKDFVPKTIIKLDNSNEYELIGNISETNPKSLFDKKYNSQINSHSGSVTFIQRIKLKTEKPVSVKGIVIYVLSNVETIIPKTYDFNIEIK